MQAWPLLTLVFAAVRLAAAKNIIVGETFELLEILLQHLCYSIFVLINLIVFELQFLFDNDPPDVVIAADPPT